MSLRKTPFKFVTAQPRRVLVGGLFATFAAVTIAIGLSSSLALSPTPVQACDGDCGNEGGGDGPGGGYGHEHGNDYDGHHENNNDNDNNCGSCDDEDNDHDHDHDNDDNDNDNGDGDGDDGKMSGDNNSDNKNGDTYDRHWREVNNYTRGNRRFSAHYNILGKSRRGRRVTHVRTRRVIRVERPRAVRYVQPRQVRVIRPRIVRELRPSYRTGYAVRAGRYEKVVYTAPAVRYAAPVSQRRVIYSRGYASSRAPAVTAYAARGRVGVRARYVKRSRRGGVSIGSVSAYAQGRNARVSIGGRARLHGNVAPRGYASESYVYADESGADVVYDGRRYRTSTYGSRGELYDTAGNCEYNCF